MGCTEGRVNSPVCTSLSKRVTTKQSRDLGEPGKNVLGKERGKIALISCECVIHLHNHKGCHRRCQAFP